MMNASVVNALSAAALLAALSRFAAICRQFEVGEQKCLYAVPLIWEAAFRGLSLQ